MTVSFSLGAYVLYQTFRWIDETGQPNNQEVEIPFSHLSHKAGISRGVAKSALEEALRGKFLRLIKAGSAKAKGESGTRTVVALNWSTTPSIAKSLDEFQGFFQGRGNFTTIPHSYFEQLLCNENLAVLRFVGFVFRNTIGYQTQFGRRKVVPLSFDFVHAYAGIPSSDTLNQAIKHSIASNYVERVEQGVFGPGKQQSTASVFAPKFAKRQRKGSKNEAGNSTTDAEQSVQKTKREEFIFRSGKGSRNEAGEGFKKRSELKNQKIETQQTSEDEQKIQLLIGAGFERGSATKLARIADREVIERQVSWMKHRKCQNQLGFLRKAILEDFDEPDVLAERRKRRERDETQKQKAKVQDGAQQQKRNKLKAYKNDLVQKWLALALVQREQIKFAAIEQSNPSLRSYLQKRSTDDSPALEFMNEMARQNNLPTTIEYESHVLNHLESLRPS